MINTLRITPLQYTAYAVTSAVTLTIVLQTFTSIRVDSWGSALAGVVLIQVVQAALQPLFSLLARILGMFGILLVSLFGYALVVWVTLEIIPGIHHVSFVGSLVGTWIYAAVIAFFQWILLAQSDEYFLRQVLRGARNKKQIQTDTPGFVFVQLDGVSTQVIEWQLNTGNLPNIRRLIDTNTYTLQSWHTQVPSTTPASQAGILFGTNQGIPAFRWYERATNQFVVANQPRSAAMIEKRLSNGNGLLVDGGVSVGNLFSGDAPHNIMVMSKLDGNRQSLRAMRAYTNYFSNLYGFMRALVLSIGEMIKEIYQAQRQRIRKIEPRVPRRASYIILRAATNVLLRDLQTTIVVDQMIQGKNSIYVDYLDYDEIAHHAGIVRPESLAALTGLDHIVGILMQAKQHTPRPYHIIFVSDHGQSQGATFKQLNHGVSLEDHIGELLGTSAVHASTKPVEQQSIGQTLLSQAAAGTGAAGSVIGRLSKKYRSKSQRDATRQTPQTADSAQVVVTGSGNLGNIWLKSFDKRPNREAVDNHYPGFINALLATKGIGLVIVDTAHQGPVCYGSAGSIELKTGKVTGANPLAHYGAIRPKDLLKVATMPNAPDIQIISSVHPSSKEVHAFEELVGNHGGIGGWQTSAILLHPTKLKIASRFYEDGELYDSTVIYRILTDWLKKSGHRHAVVKNNRN